MRKIITIAISMMLGMTLLVGCGSASKTAENTTNTTGNSVKEAKALVVYFSRAENIGGTPSVDAVSSASINQNGSGVTGNLKIMADYITEYTGADEFSILTVDAYPEGYRNTTDQAQTEKSKNARPALSTHVDNMSQYDYIFIGYPNWWGSLPMPIYTFLEEYDFTGKTIIPFASHEGSGLGSGPSEIKSVCKNATVLEGIAVRGSSVSSSQADLNKWVDGLSLNIQK